ncbi:hypothetical protein D7X33_42050 [Butyricicoccus sp. 1XD8-22]|nr:hypothetical protein D7X33_42050 [Butyricicoccus sp. 1XD8-22]
MLHTEIYTKLKNKIKYLKRIKIEDKFYLHKQNLIMEIIFISNFPYESIQLNKTLIKDYTTELNKHIEEQGYDLYCSRLEDSIVKFNEEITKLQNKIKDFEELKNQVEKLIWGDKHE